MKLIDEFPVTGNARIYAEGWQSWSPTTWYRQGDQVHRPSESWQHLMRFRPGYALSSDGIQAEGLMVVEPGGGQPARTYGTLNASSDVPTIRARWNGHHVQIEASSDVTIWTGPDDATSDTEGKPSTVERLEGSSRPASGLQALQAFGARFGAAANARTGTVPPRVWCTWYRYFEQVRAGDVIENMKAIDALNLPVDVIQIDDGWSLNTGAWTAPNPSFGPLPETINAIVDNGQRAGLWLAPFAVTARSEVAAKHPDWLTGPAGHNWGDELFGLDLTHPGVRAHLTDVLSHIRELGVDYLKLDFLYAGAVPGSRHDTSTTAVEAYRSGLQLIREISGEATFLLGCGAPILPSVGIVDAMRVSPDTFHEGGENGSQGLRGRLSLQARAWQHDRLWINDPDCMVARPEFLLRDEWAKALRAAPGLCGFSDRVAELDPHGLELVRQHMKAD